LATVAVKFNVSEATIPPRLGFRVTATVPPLAAVTVIVADADFVPSATEVAFNVTVAGAGTLPGAVYVTAEPEALVVGETVPQAVPLQPAPVTVQVTPLPAVSPVTVAVKACVPFTTTLAVGRDSVTPTVGAAAVNVIVMLADFVASATAVAVSMTVAGLGTVPGAVYVTAVPEALDPGATVPHAVPLQPAPDTVHVTPLFPKSFATMAVKACVVPTCTLAVATDIATEIAAGGGVLPPLPPLPLTDPVQPEISDIPTRVTTAIERDAKPVLDRFTTESPDAPLTFF